MDASRILSRLGFEIISATRQPASGTSPKLLEIAPRVRPDWNNDWAKEYPNLVVLDPHEHRAWRLQNWVKDAWQEKRARSLFEAYLVTTGLGKFAVQREQAA
jgi:hypothetical protein